MNSQSNIDEALTTLKEIREIIGKAEGIVNPTTEKRRLIVSLIIHTFAVVFSAFFLLGELYTGKITEEFLRSANDPGLRFQGLVSLASMIFFMVAVMYSIFNFESKNSADSLQSYISKHFPALLTLNFLSDLLVKYVALSLVILALKPEFVAALLAVFIADYLLQRRFFILPFKLAIAIAIALLGLAAFQINTINPSVAYALSTFVALSATSIISVVLQLHKLKNERN